MTAPRPFHVGDKVMVTWPTSQYRHRRSVIIDVTEQAGEPLYTLRPDGTTVTIQHRAAGFLLMEGADTPQIEREKP